MSNKYANPKAAEARAFVKEYIDPDFLGLRPTPWNDTIDTGSPLCQRPQRRHSPGKKLSEYDYRAGFKEPAAPTVLGQTRKQNTTGVEPNTATTTTTATATQDLNQSKRGMNATAASPGSGWNSSTVKAPRNAEVDLRASRAVGDALLNTTKPYVRPIERSAEITEKRRAKLKEERYLGPENVEAARKREEALQRMRERALAPRDKTGWERKAVHTGAWEFNEREQCDVWSCCMAFAHGAPGCSVSLVNPNQWNLPKMP